MQLTRRRTLALMGTGAVATTLPLGLGAVSAAAAEDPYEPLLARAAQQLTGGEVDPDDPDVAAALAALDKQAADWWQKLDRSAGRTALWSDLAPASDPGMFGQSYTRLRTITSAWATPGTSLTDDTTVRDALLDALRFLRTAGYNDSRSESGNWWFWEIGAPRALLDTCVLLRAHLQAEDRSAYLKTVAKFVPDADRRTNSPTLAETGANRADKAVIVALRGLLAGDPEVVALARDGLSDVRDDGKNSLFQYVTSGDGFYEDGSFVQHSSVAYTGTYGGVLLGSAGQLIALLADSQWSVTDPAVKVLYEAVERSFVPVLLDGVMMDALRGRAISRERARDHTDGAATASYILQLADGAPQSYADRWRSAVKGWILRNRDTPYLRLVGVPALARAKALLADTAVRPADRVTGHHVFADMDRVVHRRPGWSYTLSLSSKRIAAYEAGNGENLHGWYTGDGMTYLYDGDDLDAFGDDFWPTVNPYRLPGTTVDTRTRADLGTAPGTDTFRPKNAVAGGAVLDGKYGAAAMELIADGSTLRAKKAWFFLDNAVVALGVGITASDDRTVETVVENRNLHADGAPCSPSTTAHSPASRAGRRGSPTRAGHTWRAREATSSRPAARCAHCARNAPGPGAPSTPARTPAVPPPRSSGATPPSGSITAPPPNPLPTPTSCSPARRPPRPPRGPAPPRCASARTARRSRPSNHPVSGCSPRISGRRDPSTGCARTARARSSSAAGTTASPSLCPTPAAPGPPCPWNSPSPCAAWSAPTTRSPSRRVVARWSRCASRARAAIRIPPTSRRGTRTPARTATRTAVLRPDRPDRGAVEPPCPPRTSPCRRPTASAPR